MERILLDSLADRAATEQNRRKAVTQSRGASADPIRHASRAASVSSWRSGFVFVDRLAATPRWRGSGHDVQCQPARQLVLERHDRSPAISAWLPGGPQKRNRTANLKRWRPGWRGGSGPLKPRGSASPPFDGFALLQRDLRVSLARCAPSSP